MAKTKNVQVLMTLGKETKTTIRFEEQTSGILDTPQVGTIYVPKTTLRELGFTGSEKLVVTLSLQ